MRLLPFLREIGFHGSGSTASITLRPSLPPQYAQADEIAPATGNAVGSDSAQAVNVPVVIRDEQGNQIGADSIPLAASGHTSFVLSAKYPATANIRGTIEFDTPTGGPRNPVEISVLGLRAPSQLTFTLLPVLPK